MAEELQRQGTGVPQDAGAGQPTAPAPGTAEPETLATAPVAKPKVNLDELPEFRTWKSQADRRVAEAAREADRVKQEKAQLEVRLRELEEQSARARLQGADPEDVVKFYEQRERDMHAAYERDLRERQEAEEVVRDGLDYLASVGLSKDTPGLEWSEKPNREGLVKLIASAGRVLAAKAQAAEATKVIETQQAVQVARAEVAEETGAAKVSTGTGGSSPALLAEYEAKRSALRGTGDYDALFRLKKAYREKGLDI